MEFILHDANNPSNIKQDDILSFISETFNYNFPKLYHVNYRILGIINNKIVSHATLIDRNVQINNFTYKALLLGQVCTKKSLRNQGYGKKLLQYMVNLNCLHSADLILLNCGESITHFYTSNRFKIISQNASYDRNGNIEIDADPVLCFKINENIDTEILVTETIHLGEDF